MRISEQWLREWVSPDLDTGQLAERLTMAGLEVDKVEPAGPLSDNILVGRVTELRPHPQADRLQVATVDVGADRPLQIVCGAPNVAAGMCVPVATVGAELPGLEIKAAKLRGVESQGMLCSARELGLGDDASGLMVLPDDSPPGRPLHQWLGLDDTIIEVDLTPNRGDCLGMAGIAREVGTLARSPVTPPTVEPLVPAHDGSFPVTLAAAEHCPRFVSRVIRGVDPTARTPLWLVERLRRAGIRSLGPVVDVTNYVMLELNHPMHAYDLDKLQRGIEVRLARAGERLELLNGQTVDLDPDTLLITDASGPIGLAGIMGGATTEVSDESRDILLECAFFSPLHIAGRARRYGLHTDASHRFERGVDYAGQMRAVERATRLLLEMAGGEPGPLVDTVHEDALPSRAPITLRAARLERLLGMNVPAGTVTDILTRLGMEVSAGDGSWQVTPPSCRFDITMEADLIEEVGRVHGYQHLPVSRPAGQQRPRPISESRLDLNRLRATLLERGYQETINYSFIDAELQRLFDPDQWPLALANPISAEMAVMRTSLWPGLVKTLAYNQKRQQSRVRLFETGLVFRDDPTVGGPTVGGPTLEQLEQQPTVGGLIAGPVWPEQWSSADPARPRRTADFFDLKGDVEALLAHGVEPGKVADAVRFSVANHPALRPGQTARIEKNGRPVGWLGALHPSLLRRLDLDPQQPPLLFELALDALGGAAVPRYVPLSKFPASRRDLSLLVATEVPAETLRVSIQELGGDLLREVFLFDEYRGKGLPASQKSLTFGLILQDFSRNLTDQAVAELTARIITGLAQRHNASLRD